MGHMVDQPQKIEIQPIGSADRAEVGATDSRRVWKSPEVIVGTLTQQTASSASVATDGATHS
jgi:hypothetical protein